MAIDYVLPEGPELSRAHPMDLIMMMVLGGRERTRAEHEALLRRRLHPGPGDLPTELLPWRGPEFERG